MILKIDQITAASRMAGAWWAERLNPQHADKRVEFSAAVAKHCEAEMRETNRPQCKLEVDYDPQDAMLQAVRDVIYPDCAGVMFSARGILPQKHQLIVTPTELRPKEGYGKWTAVIAVPAVGAA